MVFFSHLHRKLCNDITNSIHKQNIKINWHNQSLKDWEITRKNARKKRVCVSWERVCICILPFFLSFQQMGEKIASLCLCVRFSYFIFFFMLPLERGLECLKLILCSKAMNMTDNCNKKKKKLLLIWHTSYTPKKSVTPHNGDNPSATPHIKDNSTQNSVALHIADNLYPKTVSYGR